MSARILYFALISLFVLEVGRDLPPLTAYAVLYFGAILACCSIFCREHLLPHRLLRAIIKYIFWHLARLCKLLTDPHWVTVQRCGFVVQVRKRLHHALRETKSLEEVLTAEGLAMLDSNRVLTERIYKETRRLRRRGDKGYFAKLFVAIRVYRLSIQLHPVREMIQQLFISGSFFNGTIGAMPFGMIGPIGMVGQPFPFYEPSGASEGQQPPKDAQT